MRMLMPQYRRWAIAAEAALLLALFAGVAIDQFSQHRNGLAWCGVAGTFVIIAVGVQKWRGAGRR